MATLAYIELNYAQPNQHVVFLVWSIGGADIMAGFHGFVALIVRAQGGRTRSRVTHILQSQQIVSHSVAVLF